MSGFKKFETSDAWRENFRKFLFMERKPEIVKSNTVTVSEKERYSLDIGDDLKNIIEQKKMQKAVQINLNDEIINTSCTATDSTQDPEKNLNSEMDNKENRNTRKDDTVYGVPMWQKTSDESFMALESMCDKTASDPNSTLFHYLHSDRKEQVLAEVKKRSADGNVYNASNEEDNLLMKINNCTLLDDVEAPSRMWENTICSDTILQTSPVKIVGLLRPSTIIEEAPDDSANSDTSSQMSFRSTTKSAQSDVSSSAYETADDLADTIKIARANELEMFDVDQMLLNAFSKNEPTAEAERNRSETIDTTIVEGAYSCNNSEDTSSLSNISENLIDLEKTFGALSGSPHSYMAENSGETKEENIGNELVSQNDTSKDSVIEILSDDEMEDVQNTNNNMSCNTEQRTRKIKTETAAISVDHGTFSFNEFDESDKENVDKVDEASEKSMQFNDTMEEVEYMLKKGMEYMAAEAAAKENNQVSKTGTDSLLKNAKTFNTQSDVQSSILTTPTTNPPSTKCHNSTSKRFDIDIKPFPKLDIFAKPAVHARPKELAGKQQKFSHIVSPIGTYMKKTAQTPLMSSINCKNKDYFNSTAIQELESESRLYKSQNATNSKEGTATGVSQLPGITGTIKRPLPKKAYISSDIKHIVDERTPLTIPGGKKIQKYLENAMVPAVLRHEGKLKISTGASKKVNTPMSSDSHSKLPLKVSDTNSKVATSASHIPRRNNASLADLSLMSGDVSMYTIMDAQKF